MDAYTILWIIFIIVSSTLFLVDLKLSVLNPHEVSLKESLKLCAIWIIVAFSYGFLVSYFLNTSKMYEYFTAYVVEYSLSVDNMFVFLMIFSFFGIEKKYQPKVLVIGILSAVFLRLIFIFAGIALINKFHWILYIFALILIYTGFKMFKNVNEKIEPDKNIVLRFLLRHIKIKMDYKGNEFFVKENNRWI